MFKKIGYIIVFLLLFIVSGCDESEDFKGAGASSISYPLNTSPLMTDQALGIDDPTGTWAINRFSFGDVFTLYLTQDFTFTGAIDTTNATSNTSGPIALTPLGTLPAAVDGKIFAYTGLAGFLNNVVFGIYDGATPVYAVGFETPPTTTGEVPTFNSVTGKFDFTTPSGGASITEVATAPDPWDLTPGNLTIDQATGTEYYLYADGSKVITRLADTSTDLFDLTLTVAETDGSTVDINGTSYGNGGPYTLSSLTGSTAMDISYVTADTTDWTGTDSGDVTGTTPNFFIDMTSADKTLVATISATASYTDVTGHVNANGTVVSVTYTLDSTETGPATALIVSQANVVADATMVGLNVFTLPTTGDSIAFDVTQSAGKFQYAFLIRTPATPATDTTPFYGFHNASTNRMARVGFEVGATTELSLLYRDNAGSYVSVTTTGASLAADTIYIIQVTVDDSVPSRKLYVYNAAGTSLIDSAENTDPFTPTVSGYTTFTIGSSSNAGVRVDNAMWSDGSIVRDFVNDEIGGTKMVLIDTTPNP